MSMIITIFAITLPIAIIIFIISAIVRSVRKEQNEESFQDIIRTMYIYLVMIIFLILAVSGIIALFNSCLDLLLPQTTQITYNSTNTDYNRSIAEVTTNLTILFISLPMFLYYSKLAKTENKKVITNITKVEVKE